MLILVRIVNYQQIFRLEKALQILSKDNGFCYAPQNALMEEQYSSQWARNQTSSFSKGFLPCKEHVGLLSFGQFALIRQVSLR